MGKNRVVPHRPPREETRAKEVSDLKRENHKLKREVKRLEKEVRKRGEQEEKEAEEGLQEAREQIIETCKKCHTGLLKVLNVAGRFYQVCLECKDRKRVDHE